MNLKQQIMDNLQAVVDEMDSYMLTCEPVSIQRVQCWRDKIGSAGMDLQELEVANNGFCEHCGPVEIGYPKDGTSWCATCMQAEGWEIPECPTQ